MLPRAYYQHEIVDAAAIPDLLSAAMLYGRGVFTTVAIHDGQAFQWELHWQRLVRDAASIGLSLETYREQQVHDAVVAVSRENALADGRVRISCFDAAAGWVGTGASILGAEMLITAGEFRQLPDRLRVCLSPYRVNSRSPLAGIKSCNYLENLLAFEAARAGGSDEGIRLNDRSHITSACMANRFVDRLSGRNDTQFCHGKF
jgi:branched-chain amino acid aminotransferase